MNRRQTSIHPKCLVTIPDVGEILFIGTTTAWRLNAESARERQVVALSDLDARHRKALPTIIVGDFNAAPDAASIRSMIGHQSLLGRSVHYHDAWAVAEDGPGYAWTCENPTAESVINQIIRQPNHRRRVDYVFVGSWHAHPKARFHIRSATLAFNQPADGVWASDHFGVSLIWKLEWIRDESLCDVSITLIRVPRLAEVAAFYEALLPALGFTRKVQVEGWLQFEAGGETATEFFGITESPAHVPNENRIAFWAENRADVDRIAKVAVRLGARNIEGPMDYESGYYAVFFEDPCGNRLEACHRTRI